MIPKKPVKNIVELEWVFKKQDTGNKDNLGFKGDSVESVLSEKGLGYQETFSPTTRHDSIRIILALAVEHKCKSKVVCNTM